MSNVTMRTYSAVDIGCSDAMRAMINESSHVMAAGEWHTLFSLEEFIGGCDNTADGVPTDVRHYDGERYTSIMENPESLFDQTIDDMKRDYGIDDDDVEQFTYDITRAVQAGAKLIIFSS